MSRTSEDPSDILSFLPVFTTPSAPPSAHSGELPPDTLIFHNQVHNPCDMLVEEKNSYEIKKNTPEIQY